MWKWLTDAIRPQQQKGSLYFSFSSKQIQTTGTVKLYLKTLKPPTLPLPAPAQLFILGLKSE